MFRHDTSVIILALLALVVIYHALLKVTKNKYFTSALIAYFFSNALYYFIFHYSILARKNATTWLLESSVLLLFAWALSSADSFKKTAKTYYYGLLTMVSASAGWLLLGNSHGLIDATSFESGMLMFALFMPVVHKRGFFEKLIVIVLAAYALKVGGSTGLAILAIYLLGRVFYSNYTKLKIATALILTAGLTYAYKNTQLLDDSGRFTIWNQYVTEWHNNANMIIGSGIGSFKNIAPQMPTVSGNLIYAHNDFLELYLETGLIGLFVLSLLLIKFFKVCYATRNLHYAAMMFVFSFNYFPGQILLTKMLFVLTIMTICKQYENLSIDKSI